MRTVSLKQLSQYFELFLPIFFFFFFFFFLLALNLKLDLEKTAVSVNIIHTWFLSFFFQCHLSRCSICYIREQNLRLFGKLLSNIIRGPSHSENYRHLSLYCMWDKRVRRHSFHKFLHKTEHSALKKMFTKCEHTINKTVAFCRWFPLFTLGTPSTIPPPLSFETRLGFYDSGFPTKPE